MYAHGGSAKCDRPFDYPASSSLKIGNGIFPLCLERFLECLGKSPLYRWIAIEQQGFIEMNMGIYQSGNQ